MSNTFGRLFRVSTFGESHGPALGCLIDGCPAGLPLEAEDIARELRRRRPGAGGPSSSRKEADEPEILSGVFEGRTLGTPIAVLVRNTGQHSADYDELRDLYRPGHADWTWEAKYGIRDHRGGGRSSARETLGRAAAGAVAKCFLKTQGITIRAWTSAAAGIRAPGFGSGGPNGAGDPGPEGFDWEEIERNPLRMPCKKEAAEALALVEELRSGGDSAGCEVSCAAWGLPPGLGEPVFDKLDARIAQAILSLGAAKGIEFGAGFAAAAGRGSEQNDRPLRGAPRGRKAPAEGGAGIDRSAKPEVWREDYGGGGEASPPMIPPGVPSLSWENKAGGMLGGISTGMPLFFTAAFKPAPSISLPQRTADRRGQDRELTIRGRHDGCIAGRVVPVVEAMTALALADFVLLQRGARV
ncbi:MAG: chorismate synthase [Treponema sp.]|jgi:chorismate synthase|nr:chorismate synthase [Treponema sp.]